MRRFLAVVLPVLTAACGASDPAGPGAPAPVRVEISPASADLLVSAGQRFTATVTGTNDEGVRFAVLGGSAGGTVTATGAYTAPATPGSFRVRATSLADSTRFAEASVTVHGYAGVFARVGDPGTPYDHHTATLLADGTVLVVGGRGFGGMNPGAERYLPDARAFVSGPTLGVARMNHVAALLPDGRLLVAGGWDPTDGQSPFDPAHSSSEIFDPVTARFGAGPAMTRPRRNHVATALADGRVLVTGGIQLRGTGFAASTGAEIYDPASGSFAEVSEMGTGRWLHSATRLADGRVLVAGGRDNNCTIDCAWESLASAEIFDPATGSFTPTGSLNVSRFAHSAALLADGRVAILGGSTTEDIGATSQVRAIEIYDPVSGTFSMAGATLMGRSYGALARLNDGRFLLAGGTNQNGNPTGTSELYEPSSGAAPGPEMTDWRIRAVAVTLGSGEVLVVGGNNSGAAVLPVDLFR